MIAAPNFSRQDTPATDITEWYDSMSSFEMSTVLSLREHRKFPSLGALIPHVREDHVGMRSPTLKLYVHWPELRPGTWQSIAQECSSTRSSHALATVQLPNCIAP